MNFFFSKSKTPLFLSIFVFMAFCTMPFSAGESHFVLVHGAWHGDWCWFEIEPALEKAGCTVDTILLPGHDPRGTVNPGSVSLEDYTRTVVSFLDTLDHPVILVGHSMGGIVISSAAQERPGKVEKLVYLSAFLLKNGQSLLDVAGSDVNSLVLPNITPDEQLGIIKIDGTKRKEMFFQNSPEQYSRLTKNLLVDNPIQPFATPLVLTPEAYGSVRRFYITTTYDNAITAAVQKQMYTDTECEKVFEIHTDHSSFFSTPNQLVNILLKIDQDSSPNVVKNSEFDTGKNSWYLITYDSSRVSGNFSVNTASQLSGSNAAQVSVTSSDTGAWRAQFYQVLEKVEKGKTYSIRFQGKTDRPEGSPVHISMQILDSLFNPVWEKKNIPLKNGKAVYGPYEFNSTVSGENMILSFDIRESEEITLYLDEIVVNPD